MDDAGRLRRGGADGNCPGAAFFGAGGEIGGEAQQLVAGADEAVEAWLFQTHFGQELRAFFAAEHGEFGF